MKEPRQARSVSSVVFQEAVVDGGLSGRANFDLHARLWGVPAPTAATRIDDLIEAFGIAELIDRPVESFSGGQRRRLEIARALVSRPQVLFLDEPTVGLDPRIRHELLDVIAGLRSRHDMTILLTTHYLDEAQQLCDRVAIIHQGEIVALDTPARLLAGLGTEILELRVDGDGDAALASLRARGIATTDAFAIGSSLTIALDGRPAGETISRHHRRRSQGLRLHDAATEARRRLPPADRRPNRRSRLTRNSKGTYPCPPRRSQPVDWLSAAQH